MQRAHCTCEQIHRARLGAADANLAGDRAAAVRDLGLGRVREVDDFGRPAAQEHTVLGELRTMAAALEQRGPQLPFELDELARQGRLRHVQRLGGGGDAPLARQGEKVLKHPELHAVLHPDALQANAAAEEEADGLRPCGISHSLFEYKQLIIGILHTEEARVRLSDTSTACD